MAAAEQPLPDIADAAHGAQDGDVGRRGRGRVRHGAGRNLRHAPRSPRRHDDGDLLAGHRRDADHAVGVGHDGGCHTHVRDARQILPARLPAVAGPDKVDVANELCKGGVLNRPPLYECLNKHLLNLFDMGGIAGPALLSAHLLVSQKAKPFILIPVNHRPFANCLFTTKVNSSRYQQSKLAWSPF